MEKWKPVIGYEGLYEVSNTGLVRSLDRVSRNGKGTMTLYSGKILKPSITSRGYCQVCLRCQGSQKNCLVHRLVAEAFVPNPDKKPQVNHIDGNKTNNDCSNLEWVTCSENHFHAYRTGLRDDVVTKQAQVVAINNRKRPVLCVETGVVYESVTEAAKAVSGVYQAISAVCRGKKSTAYGFHWKFH